MKRTIKIDQPMIDRYGQINGDNDIIHYDHEYAVKRGFRGTLAHGLMELGFAVDLAAKKWGRDWHYRGEIDVRFVGPLFPQDDLTIEVEQGKVTAHTPSGETMKGWIGLRPE